MNIARPLGLTTRLLHADRRYGVEHGALHKPIHPGVAFGYDDAADLVAAFQGSKAGFTYGRSGNPTSAALEAKISALEQGVGSICFATGMAAISHLMFALLRAGDHVVVSRHLFGNTTSFFDQLARHGVAFDHVDCCDAASVAEVLRPSTRMLFVETLANPRTQVADLKGLGELCRQHGLVYVVDNTMTSPLLFCPARVGASLVVNSLSKYIGGHGHALGGALTDTGLFDWSAFPNILEIYRTGPSRQWALTQVRKKGLRDLGGTLSAQAAHAIATGAETLELRMDRLCTTALALAAFLSHHPAVVRVDYPGLTSHAQHARAKALFGGRYGGLMAVELDARIDPVDFLNRLHLVVSSTHLGDNRTLALPVASTIYHELGAARRAELGIAETLLRVSVGIEDRKDLIADFDQALRGALAGCAVPTPQPA